MVGRCLDPLAFTLTLKIEKIQQRDGDQEGRGLQGSGFTKQQESLNPEIQLQQSFHGAVGLRKGDVEDSGLQPEAPASKSLVKKQTWA